MAKAVLEICRTLGNSLFPAESNGEGQRGSGANLRRWGFGSPVKLPAWRRDERLSSWRLLF